MYPNYQTLVLPDGSQVPIRVRRSGQIFIDWINWQDARESEAYIQNLKRLLELALGGVELRMTFEENTGETKGYWIRWTPEEIYIQETFR